MKMKLFEVNKLLQNEYMLRLKCFHIFDRVITVNMLGSLNQIISVSALLANFQEPILT